MLPIHVVDERPSKLHTVVAVLHKGTGETDISPELVFIDMLKANGMPFAADSRCTIYTFLTVIEFHCLLGAATNAQKQSAGPPE